MDSPEGVLTYRNNSSESESETFVVPHQLCDKCEPLAKNLPAYAEQVKNRGLEAPKIGYEHHMSFASLAESSRRGCHLCSILTATLSIWRDNGDAVKENKIRDTNSNDSVRIVTTCHYFTDQKRCFEYQIDILYSNGPELVSYLNVHRHSKDPADAEFNAFCESNIESEAEWPEESKYRWCKSTGSQAAFDMLLKQLNRCLADHEDCAEGSPPDFKPSRLVDLAPFGETSSMDVRVVPGSSTTSHYATLSYCRGGIAPCVLNAETYNAFHERIPWSDLPKTMRDAILICRRLSIRYIWIDSLCIVQGADGDIHREAAQMRTVYSGSIFTIAAADSIDPHGGCFRERFPLRYADCRLYEDDEQLIFVRANALCRSMVVGKVRDESESQDNGCTPGKCVLDERAWVLQERMLSPRTLYFGRGDIHFECREGLICESTHDHSWYPALKPIYLELTQLDEDDFETSYRRFQELWHEILERYSQTKLRREEDRLLAIAGIVDVPQSVLGLQSSFGLWTASLVDELCWYIADRTRSSELRIPRFEFLPTWSWLRLVGSQVGNMEDIPYRSEFLDRLYEADVTEPPEITPFVQLTKLSTYRNTLKLKARCVECRVVLVEGLIGQAPWALIPSIQPPKEVYGDEEPQESSAPSNKGLKRIYGFEYGQRTCCFHADRPSSLVKGQTLHCLLVKRDRMTDRFGGVYVWDFALVLKREKNGDKTAFSRVGVYCEGNSRLDVKDSEGKLDDNEEDDDALMELLVSQRMMFPEEEGEDMEVLIR